MRVLIINKQQFDCFGISFRKSRRIGTVSPTPSKTSSTALISLTSRTVTVAQCPVPITSTCPTVAFRSSNTRRTTSLVTTSIWALNNQIAKYRPMDPTIDALRPLPKPSLRGRRHRSRPTVPGSTNVDTLLMARNQSRFPLFSDLPILIRLVVDFILTFLSIKSNKLVVTQRISDQIR